jgi:hypothetical protein
MFPHLAMIDVFFCVVLLISVTLIRLSKELGPDTDVPWLIDFCWCFHSNVSCIVI